MLRHFCTRAYPTAAALVLAVYLGLYPPPSWGQVGTAVVAGADRLYVRRGPGTEFPPFTTLQRGSTVEVKEIRNDWARVVTAGGQVGFVNMNYLALRGRATRSAPTAGEGQPAATPVTSASDAATLRQRNEALAAEAGDLRAQLAELTGPTAAEPAAVLTPTPAAADTQELDAQLQRLTASVEALSRRLDDHPAGTDELPAASQPMIDAPTAVVGRTVLFGVLGVVVGWVLGSTYARKQERGRRSRIRL